jgi:hypothetical protein
MASSILVITGPSGVGKSTVSGLVSRSFELGVHLPIDDVERFIVAGWVDQASPEVGRQNHAVGSAGVSAAMQFAVGGYTVVVDGCIFPDVLPGLANACRARGVALHYAVLRAGSRVCLERASRRAAGDIDEAAFQRLWDRFADLSRLEQNVIDASADADAVAAAVLQPYRQGRLLVR